MTEKCTKSDQTFDFNTMTAVIYSMMKDNVVLGARHYQVRAALNGTRTASAYEHDFRNAKRRAKELFDKGDALDLKIKENAQSKKSSNGVGPTNKPNGKRGREPKNAQPPGKTEGTDDNSDSDDFGGKKVKVEKEDEFDLLE